MFYFGQCRACCYLHIWFNFLDLRITPVHDKENMPWFLKSDLFYWPFKASCWILFRSLSSVGGGYIWHLFGNFGDNSIQPKLKQYLNSPHALPQTRSKWNSNLIFPEAYSKKFMQCIQSSWEWRLSFLQWWFCISKHETALPNFLFNISPNLTICKWN